MRSEILTRARQEIDAEFVQLAGALFKRQNIKSDRHRTNRVSWVRSWEFSVYRENYERLHMRRKDVRYTRWNSRNFRCRYRANGMAGCGSLHSEHRR